MDPLRNYGVNERNKVHLRENRSVRYSSLRFHLSAVPAMYHLALPQSECGRPAG